MATTSTPLGSLEAHFPGLGEFLVDLDLDLATSSSRVLPTPAREAAQANLAADRRASELRVKAWKVFWTLVLLWVTILVVISGFLTWVQSKSPISLVVFAPFQFLWPLAVTELVGILIFGIGWAIKKVSQRSTNKADHELTEVVVEP